MDCFNTVKNKKGEVVDISTYQNALNLNFSMSNDRPTIGIKHVGFFSFMNTVSFCL